MSYRIHTASAGRDGNVQAAVITPDDSVTVAGYLADFGAVLTDDVQTPALVIVDMVGQEVLVITGDLDHLVYAVQPIVDELIAKSDGDLADLFGGG